MDSEYVTAVDPTEEPDPTSAQKPKFILEAILFAASEPISVEQFQAVLPALDKRAIRRELDELRQDYQEMRRSIRLVEIANGYQICTRPEYSGWIEQFYTRQVRVKLSPQHWRHSQLLLISNLLHGRMSLHFAV